jgi:hypothetical protein
MPDLGFQASSLFPKPFGLHITGATQTSSNAQASHQFLSAPPMISESSAFLPDPGQQTYASRSAGRTRKACWKPPLENWNQSLGVVHQLSSFTVGCAPWVE